MFYKYYIGQVLNVNFQNNQSQHKATTQQSQKTNDQMKFQNRTARNEKCNFKKALKYLSATKGRDYFEPQIMM